MKIIGSYKVFEDNISWGQFISSPKTFQDGRTHEKSRKKCQICTLAIASCAFAHGTNLGAALCAHVP